MTEEPPTPPDNAVALHPLGNGRETLAMLTGSFEAARLIPLKAPVTTVRCRAVAKVVSNL
jgi:hypothetical protein